MRRLSACLVFLFAFATLHAEDQEGVFLDPESAGIDYEFQGEYLGVVDEDGESTDFGLQVIALGDHKFDAVAYLGGLPGGGWKRGDEQVKATGTLKDGVLTLVAEVGTAVIREGHAEILEKNGDSIGKLKKVVRLSPTLGAKPPEGAVVLFDGSSADHFKNGKMVMGGLLAANCESKMALGDHTLHLEFRTPFKPAARGQARGNSGVYLQSRYECQVLDSFGLEGKDNECGGIYKVAQPAVNACFPPLTWQTYDIDFTAARWEDGQKVSNARATIRHNGIVIHEDLELPTNTPGKQKEAEGPAPLYLQGHGNPVVYRNIWAVTK